MAGEDKQQFGLSVLKSFNAAVTTTKLYPPHFPQVAASIEKAFELITSYLGKYKTLSFSLIDDEPKMCGLPVSQKTLGKVHGEDVFRQLRLLNLNHVVLEKECDRATFNALITFFTTSPQLISKEGGSRAFIVNLGLDELLPENYTVEIPAEKDDTFTLTLEHLRSSGRATNEDIQTITNVIDGETIAGQKKISAFAARTLEPGGMVDLIVASVAHLLKDVCCHGELVFPLSFATLMRNVDRIVDGEEKSALAKSTAVACRDSFTEFGLHALFLQHYPRGFGALLYEQLLAASAKTFDKVVQLIHQEEAAAAQMMGKSSDQYHYVTAGIERLFATEKGKQYLLREKAKTVLNAGEKERQAKRIQAGIRQILKGDVNGLRNKELVRNLPATIESLISKGKDKAAATIITNITTELLKSDDRSHNLLGECLGSIAESLINTEKWDWLEKVSVPLIAWVKETDRADEVYENIIDILLKLQKYYWDNAKDKQADTILKLFFAIRTGKFEKSQDAVAIVSRLQDRAAERSPLSGILEKSVENNDEFTDRRLIMQGPLATRFLLNKLLESKNTKERLKILELLRRKKSLLPPILLEKLASPMPWHGKRNLLKLLAETGSKEHARKIIEYLNHEDIRVQQEAFLCIQALSGDDLKDNLLDALTFSSGPMMEQVVRALPPVADEEVVGAVADLLDDWKHFPDEIRDSLLEQSAKLLGMSTSSVAEKALEEFLLLENKSKARMIGDQVWLATKLALRKLKARKRERSKEQIRQTVEEFETESEDVEQQTAHSAQRSSFAEEPHIEHLLGEGNIERAKTLLLEIIEKAARRELFDEATRLREWLIEIDPSALSDIIATAEMIEEAKREGISNDYLQVWSNLHDNLTSEEFNAMYYAMEHSSHSAEDVLVQQGDMYPALFFVNEGKVKLYHDNKHEEVLLKIVEQGEIFGADTFFDASLWTVSAATLSKAEISVLPQKNITNWSDESPALEAKLHDFAAGFSSFEKKVEDSATDRREFERNTLHGIARITISDGIENESSTQLKGELANISRGGLCLMVRISKKNNARVLLGRKISIQLECTGISGETLTKTGELVSVRSLYSTENEYSLHLRFSRPLDENELRGILEANSPANA
jgi:CRP-like cAMP-binding protein